jgi:hypothetical protein
MAAIWRYINSSILAAAKMEVKGLKVTKKNPAALNGNGIILSID